MVERHDRAEKAYFMTVRKQKVNRRPRTGYTLK
jgi:hypothetical protein